MLRCQPLRKADCPVLGLLLLRIKRGDQLTIFIAVKRGHHNQLWLLLLRRDCVGHARSYLNPVGPQRVADLELTPPAYSRTPGSSDRMDS